MNKMLIMVYIDPGGYWWPPAYSTWAHTIVSFSFPVSLIVAQFTIFRLIFFEVVDAKKRCLGPQNSSRSLGLEKLLKIVNCATIKETEKLKETMVWAQVE
jgi:hypothetical protein